MLKNVARYSERINSANATSETILKLDTISAIVNNAATMPRLHGSFRSGFILSHNAKAEIDKLCAELKKLIED